MGLLDCGDRVTVAEEERIVRRLRDADLGARPTRDGFVEPDLFDERRVLHQTQQRGPGGHQGTACLFLGQPVQAAVERRAVLVEERLELGVRRLGDDLVGEGGWERRHGRSIPDRHPAEAGSPSGPVSKSLAGLRRAPAMTCRVGDWSGYNTGIPTGRASGAR
ncbi:hypothetical protein GCM10029963_03060 [Micromonospora andamanensis]